MLDIIRLILSGILAVVLLGMILGGMAFFATIGIGFAVILIGGTVLGIVIVGIYEWITDAFRRFNRRRRQSNSSPRKG